MAIVTLIGEKLSIKDLEFTYLGPNNDCRNCQLKNVCFNLKIGRKYKITNVRDKKHVCNVHEGAVKVVEVEELPIKATINKNLSKGTKTKATKKECKSIGCDFHNICTNIAIQKDKTYEIKKTNGKIPCPNDYELYEVELTD